MTALAPRQSQALPSLCSPLSAEGMAKAMRVFSRLEPVTEYTRLIDPDSAARIIATVDRDLQPCSREQATSLVAELLGAYPGIAAASRSSEEVRDFKLYTVKLFEAFSLFSFAIGKCAVHGGSGIPAKQRFKPQPSDIVEFCTAEKVRRLDVKTMAQRHLAEAKRRGDAAAEDAKYRLSPEAKARVQNIAASFKARAMT